MQKNSLTVMQCSPNQYKLSSENTLRLSLPAMEIQQRIRSHRTRTFSQCLRAVERETAAI